MQPRPWTCPLCGAPLIIIFQKLSCVYCQITNIGWTPFKTVQLAHFTAKELEEMEAKRKEQEKQANIKMEQMKREQLKKMENEDESPTKDVPVKPKS